MKGFSNTTMLHCKDTIINLQLQMSKARAQSTKIDSAGVFIGIPLQSYESNMSKEVLA